MSTFLLGDTPIESLDAYFATGGGEGLELARSLAPGVILDQIAASGLRGRGGAGFPTATKWQSVVQGGPGPRFVVCNAAEGEPGTFKDRRLLRANPYQVLEGLLIAAVALGAHTAFIALKASFRRELARVEQAIAELQEADMLEGIEIRVVLGPEEYLFGEEKALLEVIEGNEPLPRWLPPYLHGLFVTAPQMGWSAHEPEPGHVASSDTNPTLVNNVETLADVTHIIARGPDWFRTMGTPESPGTVLCTVTGDVRAPVVVEVEMGTPLADVLGRAGGSQAGRSIRAVFSGASNAVLSGEQLATPVSYEAMVAAGSGLGSAGFIVYDDTACLLQVARILSRFLYVESCGQCPPCKLGTGAITDALDRLGAEGTMRDLAVIQERLPIVTDGSRCYLPAEEQAVVSSILRTFPDDIADHLEGRCRRRHDLPIPKIVDIADGVVTYDARQAEKNPDWTYRS
jgi:NADH:ubiquinone oxidoreductase subunit F (NADH-binding)